MRQVTSNRDFFVKSNWSNLEWVITQAKKLGKGMVVIKYPERSNYNITHDTLARTLPRRVEIVYRIPD